MKEIWQTKLNSDFPGGKITVNFLEEDSEDITEYQITFYQER